MKRMKILNQEARNRGNGIAEMQSRVGRGERMREYRESKQEELVYAFLNSGLITGHLSLVTSFDHQGITLRSRQNLAVSFCGASEASQTIPEAPSATERVAPDPPISVLTQPGQTELTAKLGNAAAS